MDDMRSLVRIKRKSLLITQKELAEKLNIREATISDFETGKTSLSSDILEKIFIALDIKLQ